MPNRVVPLSKQYARQAARLHAMGIGSGFLSSLGQGFLRQLYAAISSSPSGFGFVCVDEEDRVLGFIACAESVGRLYKQSLMRRGIFMAAALARFLIRPAVIARAWQTLRYPSEVSADLPPAEVLSIAVDERCRGLGVGRDLMEAANAEFRRRGIVQVKAAVGAALVSANAFYLKCGFRLAATQQHHGLPMNLYIEELER
ncbi:MAG: GNAT family N-acetyltransferase [Planctomycetaceae bacterium]|nr:GNAT family N-acetyltransferase [Planctomycetaceae bacterium]